ncbi:hypothetical protein J6590_042884 [Homalodisca vitripennis]|nr:hypothetical protein J6590_042884 [Homalodisca vitripennis]
MCRNNKKAIEHIYGTITLLGQWHFRPETTKPPSPRRNPVWDNPEEKALRTPTVKYCPNKTPFSISKPAGLSSDASTVNRPSTTARSVAAEASNERQSRVNQSISPRCTRHHSQKGALDRWARLAQFRKEAASPRLQDHGTLSLTNCRTQKSSLGVSGTLESRGYREPLWISRAGSEIPSKY